VQTLLVGVQFLELSSSSLSLTLPSSINCDKNSSDTRILKHPFGDFRISKGWQVAAFFRNAFLEDDG
jgi:hypothetical protein